MQGMRVFLFDHGGDTRTERRHPPGGVDLRPKEQRKLTLVEHCIEAVEILVVIIIIS